MINGIILTLALSNAQLYAQVDYCSDKFQQTGFTENYKKIEELKKTIQLSSHEIIESKEIAVDVSKSWNYNFQGLYRCLNFQSDFKIKEINS